MISIPYADNPQRKPVNSPYGLTLRWCWPRQQKHHWVRYVKSGEHRADAASGLPPLQPWRCAENHG
ncbi:hypothetical protein DMH88_12245 [Escherichia coli]|nr:hypothetical protein [Escherichia coli]